MSLFGKKTPVAVLPTGRLRTDGTIFVGGIIQDSGMKSGDKSGYLQLHVNIGTQLHDFLVGKILPHLPSKHQAAFLEMHNQHKSYAEVDEFLEETWPNAKQIVTDACTKFWRRFVAKGD